MTNISGVPLNCLQRKHLHHARMPGEYETLNTPAFSLFPKGVTKIANQKCVSTFQYCFSNDVLRLQKDTRKSTKLCLCLIVTKLNSFYKFTQPACQTTGFVCNSQIRRNLRNILCLRTNKKTAILFITPYKENTGSCRCIGFMNLQFIWCTIDFEKKFFQHNLA